jgi:hypothetical protein
MTKEEFIIWGIAPGQTIEDVLFTNATSMSEARRAANVLICKHGCKAVRIQVLKLSEKFDFTKEFCKS